MNQWNEIEISKIIISEDRRKLNPEKVKELSESIKEIGLLNPITLNEENKLIAGLHRIEAYKLLGKTTVPYFICTVSGLLAELAEIDENLIRNELTVLERSEQLLRRKEIYEMLYPETIARNQPGHVNNYKSSRAESALELQNNIFESKSINPNQNEPKQSFVKDTAKKTGHSVTKVKDEIRIANKIDTEVKEQIRSTELANKKTELLSIARETPEVQKTITQKIVSGTATSVRQAKQQIRSDEIKDSPPIIPTGKYNIIYADPPWTYDDTASAGERGACFKYNVMSIEDLCNMPIKNLAADDCLLFMWVTMPKLNECFRVIEAWGFKYKTVAFTWVKRNKNGVGWFWGMGRWTRSNAELCLLAGKGNPIRISGGVHSIIDAPVEEHSKKPNIVRERIIELCGDLKRIELFARQKIPGWEVFGNEI